MPTHCEPEAASGDLKVQPDKAPANARAATKPMNGRQVARRNAVLIWRWRIQGSGMTGWRRRPMAAA
jgi:hypothetical protein